jgi:hypothetical protein
VLVAVGTIFSVAVGSIVGFEVSEGVFGVGEGVPMQLVIVKATTPSNKIPSNNLECRLDFFIAKK